MDFSSSNIKNFFTFFREKAVLIFQEKKPQKKFLYFLKRKLFYISGNGNP